MDASFGDTSSMSRPMGMMMNIKEPEDLASLTGGKVPGSAGLCSGFASK